MSVAIKAHNLVYGDRRKDYGHPIDDYRRVAKMWGAILDCEVTPMQAALCMIAIKISRQCNKHKNDNLVDIAGYAAVCELIGQAENDEQGNG
jgi:hypothetical protein